MAIAVRPLSFLLLPAETSRVASFFVIFASPAGESAETQNRSPLHRKHRVFHGFSPPSNFMDFMISPKRTGGNPTFSVVVRATPENSFEQKVKAAILPKKLEMTPSVTQTADLIFKRNRQKTPPELNPTG